MARSLDIVILGLSVTSSWGNGHATTYRSLIRGLAGRGHRILFLERDVEWYRDNRDQPVNPYSRIALYHDLTELKEKFEAAVARADLVIVGSFVPEGIAVGEWVTAVAKGVTAFYDIDTPVTYGKLEAGDCDYVTPALIARYDMYLSFTGGPILKRIEQRYGSPMARVLYCSVDPSEYFPVDVVQRWDLGYLGTYSSDRQPALERLLLEPARRLPEGRFAVAGPMYPDDIVWPRNVERTIHLEPALHRDFYSAQRFTLNITRVDMIAAGYSPSVRLFEAGACGVPVISDWWSGLDTLLEPGKEILIAETADDVLRYLAEISNEERRAIGARARERILAAHTPQQRALQLESYYSEAVGSREEQTETHDGTAAHSPRRDGRGGKQDHGLAARSFADRSRTTAGDSSGGATVGGPAARGLRESAGTGDSHRRGSGTAAQSAGPDL